MTTARSIDNIRFAGSRVGEIMFVLDMFAIALIAGGFLLGLNPFVSLAPALVVAATPLIMLWHHRWFERHRSEILAGSDRHADRERRGF